MGDASEDVPAVLLVGDEGILDPGLQKR